MSIVTILSIVIKLIFPTKKLTLDFARGLKMKFVLLLILPFICGCNLLYTKPQPKIYHVNMVETQQEEIVDTTLNYDQYVSQ